MESQVHDCRDDSNRPPPAPPTAAALAPGALQEQRGQQGSRGSLCRPLPAPSAPTPLPSVLPALTAQSPHPRKHLMLMVSTANIFKAALDQVI